jgi:hypothetical protein
LSVVVKGGLVKGQKGEVVTDTDKVSNKYKIDFGDGWVGWHYRNNLNIVKKNRRKDRVEA